MTEKQNYLFICGCPRSGTTALVNLLNHHPSIAIGMERYKHYATQENIHKINPDAFSSQYFFDLKKEQTNIMWETFYKNLVSKYQLRTNVFLGDKYPHYYKFYDRINEQFNNVKWIFIIRDIVDVALSYNVRAANPEDKWPENADYRKAVIHWNDSLSRTWKYIKHSQQDNLFVCEYERLFAYDREHFEALVNFLEIDSNFEFESLYSQSTKNWEQRQSLKAQIDNQQLEYINAHANTKLKDNLLHKFDLSRK